MNVPIRRLLAVVLLLFALLVGFTSQWSVFDADDLEAKTENKRPLFEAQQIKRGKITTADGEVIANSTKTGENESYQYVRKYPQGSLFGNPIGYSFITQGTSGFERAENATLTGEENEFVSIIDQIRGQQREGSDIVTTLDASAPAARDRSARGDRPARRGGRDGPVDRRDPGDGEHARLRPEHRSGRPGPAQQRRPVGADEPGDPVALPSGLDLQGRDRRGGARLRRRDAGHGPQRRHPARPSAGSRSRTPAASRSGTSTCEPR